jgi:molybdate transport system permease protein
LPLAASGLVAGAAMSWARALGEFGATLMFAGNLEGRTQTLPLAIYTALEEDLRVAQAIAVVLVVVAFALLLVVRGALRRSTEPEGGARP